MTACKLNDIEFMDSIAAPAMQEHSEKIVELLSTLEPSQKKIFIRAEEVLMEGACNVQRATVKALWCPRCRVKTCPEAA